jgi:DNA-directed RNA polymerase I subunit RPA2
MHADLYIGVVLYQRLRHMVSDKYQVRATGAVNQLTRQPIKGRKKGGGIRLGEMERDALLSHGTAFLLHDRLMNCSDKHIGYCCGRCGGVLSPQTKRETTLSAGTSSSRMKLVMTCIEVGCRDLPEMVEPVALPYVFKYLSFELAGMGIKMQVELKQ